MKALQRTPIHEPQYGPAPAVEQQNRSNSDQILQIMHSAANPRKKRQRPQTSNQKPSPTSRVTPKPMSPQSLLLPHKHKKSTPTTQASHRRQRCGRCLSCREHRRMIHQQTIQQKTLARPTHPNHRSSSSKCAISGISNRPCPRWCRGCTQHSDHKPHFDTARGQHSHACIQSINRQHLAAHNGLKPLPPAI